jgi:hypothetical protein
MQQSRVQRSDKNSQRSDKMLQRLAVVDCTRCNYDDGASRTQCAAPIVKNNMNAANSGAVEGIERGRNMRLVDSPV